MEHLNKRKPNLLFFWFLLPFILYGGYAVGKLEGDRISMLSVTILLLVFGLFTWTQTLVILLICTIMFCLPEGMGLLIVGLTFLRVKIMDSMSTR